MRGPHNRIYAQAHMKHTHLLGELIKDKAFDTADEAAARDHLVHRLFLFA